MVPKKGNVNTGSFANKASKIVWLHSEYMYTQYIYTEKGMHKFLYI